MFHRRHAFAGVAALAAVAALAVPASFLLAQDAQQQQQASAAGATGTFKVDPVHSAVIFRTTHLNASASWGRINNPTGTFDISDDEVKFDVTVDLANIDTDNAKRDEHLRGPDFFNAKQFPTMSFKSTSSKKTDATTYEVTGDLTVKGVTKSITVTMKKIGENAKNPMNKTLVGFETEFTVNRLDYGVSYMPGMLGNDVRVIVALEGAK